MIRDKIDSLSKLGSSAIYLFPGLGSYLSFRSTRYIPDSLKKLDVPSVILSGIRFITIHPAYWTVPSLVFHNLPLGIVLGLSDLIGYAAAVRIEQHKEHPKEHLYTKSIS